MDKDSKFTRDEDGYVAVRTVTGMRASASDDRDSMFTRDEDGYVAIRTVAGAGSSGGDSHNKGYYATPEALREAYPTAEAGDFAVVGSTDTIWIWDSDTSAWKDSDQKGQVTSVNNQTGDVTLTASDVGALASGDNVSSLVNDAGYLTQHQSIKTVNNTSLVGTGNVDVQETLVSGTNIKTINNQSLLGNGNLAISGGIDWAVHEDIAADTDNFYWGLEFDALPDGHYEVYVQQLSVPVATDEYLPVTQKISFFKNGTTVNGKVYLVTEDTSIGTFGYDPQDDITVTYYKTTDNKDSMCSEASRNGWYIAWKDFDGTGNTVTIQNAIRATNIKNVDTGVSYTPTIKKTSDISIDWDYPQSSLLSTKLVELPWWQLSGSTSTSVNDLWGFYVNSCVLFGETNLGNCAGIHLVLYYQDDVFDVDIYNHRRPYYKENEKSGVFADTVIKDGNHQPIVVLNLPVSVSGSIFSMVNQIGGGEPGYNVSTSPIDVNNIPLGLQDVPCVTVGSTVNETNYGWVEQYTGATNANYTKGSFYEATGTLVPTSGSVTVLNISDPNVTISIDVDTLIPLLEAELGWSTDSIISGLNDGYNWYFNSDGSSLTSVYNGLLGNFSSQAILDCFTITGWDYQNQLSCSTRNYVPPHNEVQNGRWERIDVQPSATTPSTMPTLAIADWTLDSGTNKYTQTVNVTGVTANNVVLISPDPTSADEYASCGVICISQGAGALTFQADSVPASAITVNIVTF